MSHASSAKPDNTKQSEEKRGTVGAKVGAERKMPGLQPRSTADTNSSRGNAIKEREDGKKRGGRSIERGKQRNRAEVKGEQEAVCANVINDSGCEVGNYMAKSTGNKALPKHHYFETNSNPCC